MRESVEAKFRCAHAQIASWLMYSRFAKMCNSQMTFRTRTDRVVVDVFKICGAITRRSGVVQKLSVPKEHPLAYDYVQRQPASILALCSGNALPLCLRVRACLAVTGIPMRTMMSSASQHRHFPMTRNRLIAYARVLEHLLGLSCEVVC